ncbi:zinc metalloproteinase-disintegrin-like batroxstatin-1 [Corticium candelabrum]|uniref:zinc metalloproteinase-disintegrin-like batroxstatin-1 n=1 Tax=Corticium candelabrum TaxID=121492 RepID=UPI002E268E4C|nr:zinc metalloproteinase-disintegrin-like batroxstatin-1 [Corticium candelabrum]XP_062522624.1 zinc metalloproteinase-disintegrin-like batroxstatin-1 [Corticium candelabrum]
MLLVQRRLLKKFWLLYALTVSIILTSSQHSASASRLKRDAVVAVPRDEAGKVISKVSTRLVNGQHQDRISFRLEIFGRNYTLDLDQNRRLVSSSFKEVYFSSTGDPIINKDFENCFYHGTIRGIANSQVVVSTCNGLSGLFYHGKDPETFYFIDPAKQSNEDQFSDGHIHTVYRASDLEDESITFCDGVHGNYTAKQTFLHPGDVVEDLRAGRVRRDVASEEKIVELVLVNDNKQFQARGSDITQVADRSISLANMVDSLYKQLNTRIALVGVEVWNDADRISVVTSPSATLNAFASYRQSQLLTRFEGHDNAHLLTGLDLDGATVGLAFVKGICSDFSSAGIDQDTFSEAASASIIAHELGHNLGMLHDDGRACDDCPTGCLMRASFNAASPFTSFSTCSREDYEQTLLDGFGVCLFNTPTELFDDPDCGNGFVEDGEGCDCGSAAECSQKNDTCCNSTICQLFDGAQCSSARPCCTSDCKFASLGTLCRDQMNICDLQDFCSGSSAECPDNLFLQDLTTCSATPEAVCYNGQCETHDLQCKEIWGENATNAADICYSNINVRGSENGNCGSFNSSFIPCTLEDVNCGLLICQGGAGFPIISISGATIQAFFTTFTVGSTEFECKRARVTIQDSVTDLGIVRDGSQCGSSKLCQAHRCIDFSSLNVPSCPTDQSGNICSGNGVCNNLDQCSCSSGFLQPNCTTGK